jgi:hypothetical protein
VPRVLAVTLLAAVAATTSTPLSAQTSDPHWQVSLSSYVSNGDYGTDASTRFTYTPLSLRWLSSRGDVTVIVPYLDVSSDSSVLIFRGMPQPTAPERVPTPSRGADPRRATPAPTPESAPELVTETTREKGLGDIAISGRYFWLNGTNGWPMVDLTARLELPTGDEARGLGLGAGSAELGLQVSKPLGRSFITLADASYTFVGQPEGFDVRNTWEYSVGLGCYPVRSVLLSLAYEEWRPISEGVANGRDLLASATIKAGRSLRVFASAQFPLSDTAPDFTAGGGVGVRF